MPVKKDYLGLTAVIRPGSPHQRSGDTNSVMSDDVNVPDTKNPPDRSAYGPDKVSNYKRGGTVKKYDDGGDVE